MTEYLLPVLYGLAVWWVSTVLIIWLDGLPKHTFKWSMAGATVVMAGALYGLWWSAGDASVAGAYVAFTCGVFAWGWQEISFYMGYVTGPRKQPCPEGCKGLAHFWHAVETNLWHELAIMAAAALVVGLTWDQPNQIGMWTFLVLWWMHQSAKLNVFFGVRNINAEFLPEHLSFLKGFLTKKPMNLLFPVSVTVSTVITVLLVQAATATAATAFEAAGYTFLAAFMALAVLEHWLLVLPLPQAKLWDIGLKSRKQPAAKPFDAEVVVGFLGAGKTTLLRRLLAEADPDVKTVVLVNDFGALGLDGTLLSGRGAGVVELPNGCICCSLRKDLAAQLTEIIAREAPDRVLIEPSGVADVAALVGTLNAPALRPLLRSLKVCTVIDAGAFLRDYARLPEYFEAQARLSPTFIVNKTDLAAPGDLAMIRETLATLNPAARLLAARHGQVEGLSLATLPGTDLLAPAAEAHDHDHHHGHEHHHGHDHDHHHGPEALGLTSWSTVLEGSLDRTALRRLLDAVAAGEFGEIDRLKGIAPAGGGWVHFDVAGGHVSTAAFAPRPGETARVVAIGRTVEAETLAAAFAACRTEAAPAEAA